MENCRRFCETLERIQCVNNTSSTLADALGFSTLDFQPHADRAVFGALNEALAEVSTHGASTCEWNVNHVASKIVESIRQNALQNVPLFVLLDLFEKTTDFAVYCEILRRKPCTSQLNNKVTRLLLECGVTHKSHVADALNSR